MSPKTKLNTWLYWQINHCIVINWYLFQLRKAYFKQLEEIGSLKEQISLKDKRIRQLEEEISMLKLPVAGAESGEGQSECWVSKNHHVMLTSSTLYVNMRHTICNWRKNVKLQCDKVAWSITIWHSWTFYVRCIFDE